MIGRFRSPGILAHVGAAKIAQVVAAGLLMAAASVAEHLLEWPPVVVIVLASLSLALTAFPIVAGALRGLLRLETNVDELVSLAIIASVVLGEWSAAAIVAFIMVLGGLIEEVTAERARAHIEKLGASSPDQALLIDDDGATKEVAAAALAAGQIILVRPGDVVAADGQIEVGSSEIDESMLTGESVAIYKGVGEMVSAGTINTHGSLHVRVEKVGEETAHGRILRIIEEAEKHRAPLIRVAERYAKWFTPAILALAAAVWLISGDVYRAVTMLIVGCPCAFVLATPTAVMAALGSASRHGVLIKGGKYLEACSKITTVAFDKTGTLTQGAFQVTAVEPWGSRTKEDVLREAARLESFAEHPLAQAIVAYARSQGVAFDAAATIRRHAGQGVSDTEVDGDGFCIGHVRYLKERGVEVPEEALNKIKKLSQCGATSVLLAQGIDLWGIITVEDKPREEALDVLHHLMVDGLPHPIMLTGDSPEAAAKVGEELRFVAEDIHARQLPEQKYALLRELEKSGQRVCYVGDGTNDGPALAVATVGVSIGSRENTVALETADAVLMKGGLAHLPFLLKLGRDTARTINQNLILFGLALNATWLLLSAAGLLTPVLGAVAHNAGSVAVVLNSARLLRASPRQAPPPPVVARPK